MSTKRLINIDFPDIATKPEAVKKCWEALPTKVNLFRMMAHSAGSFVPMMEVVDVVFKSLSLSDIDRELLVLLVGARTHADYEWDQHVVISQAFGVTHEQIAAIAERRIESDIFTEKQRTLLRLGEEIIYDGAASPYLVNRAAELYPDEQVCDAILTVGFYLMIASFLKSLQIPCDAQNDGKWIKR